jgi:hypothetical protein
MRCTDTTLSHVQLNFALRNMVRSQTTGDSMQSGKHLPLRAFAIIAALLIGSMELMALQKARLTRWRLTHEEA